jgi:hypothetical protein
MKRYISLNEASKVSLPDTIYYLVGYGRDKNGNSIVKILNDKTNKIFSIQINNPEFDVTYRNRGKRPSEISKNELKNISNEITYYVDNYGTSKMR